MLMKRRCYKKVPDPFLGPKGIRWLLIIRGVCGKVQYFLSDWSMVC